MEFLISGALTASDANRHITHMFTVPIGAEQILIDFEYAPNHAEKYSDLLVIGLSDPVSERGIAHRGQRNQHIELSAAHATPGFIPGKLIPGQWQIELNVFWINPGVTVNYRLSVVITRHQTNAAPRWYRGDLHGHSLHSDARWDIPDLVNFAREHQLDFVTLTDHNTLSGLKQMDSLSSSELLTMGGFELTTFYGHALALGIRHLIDWRVIPGQRTIEHIKGEIERMGGLFIIAHPKSAGGGYCTGCRWDYGDMMPGTARNVEVWNGPWDSDSNNDQAIQMWYQWLNQGYAVFATAGTDIHGPSEKEYGFNVVYAEAFDEAAILEAVRRGHSYLSSGPQIVLNGVSSEGYSAMMGDRLQGTAFKITAQWSNCRDGDTVHFIVDGAVQEQIDASSAELKSWELTGNHWCLIEIRDQGQRMRALSNPIFLE